MKLNRTYLFITISTIALVIVLIIQINWMLEAAKVKENIFNEKANLVLSKTAEALSLDIVTYKNIQTCVGINEKHKMDSLFTHYMNLYKIHIDYFFEVKQGEINNVDENLHYNNISKPIGCYQTAVKDPSKKDVTAKNGMQLKLIIPDAEEFVIEEMGLAFISSIILILIVLVMSWRTIISLMKEKQISEHTTDFLNNMTHEFKTPLTNIALAGRMMINDANVNQEAKIKHYSTIILSENEKLRLQVEQVLSMTALERGEIPLQKTAINLHQLIHDSLKCISVQIENKKGNVNLNLEAINFIIFGDTVHLTNVLCNLLDNAIKYTGEEPQLLIKTLNKDQNLIITVSDNGIGIDADYQEKIFDKFFRVPTGDVHDVKGFGLGLTYVKTIIASHGGTIEVQSEKGMGTVFVIRLPYV